MDLGECPKIHDLALRADYQNASAEKDFFYDIDVSITYRFAVFRKFRNPLYLII